MIKIFWKWFAFNLCLFSFERLAFWLWNHKLFINQTGDKVALAFIYGLRFDLASVSMLGGLVFILCVLGEVLPLAESTQVLSDSVLVKYQKYYSQFVFGIYLVIFWGFQLFQWTDIEFIHFVGRRMTKDSLWFAKEVPGQFWSLLIYYWPLSLAFIFFTIIFTFVSYRIWLPWQRKLKPEQEGPIYSGKKTIFAGLVTVVCLVVLGRGGLQLKPISYVHAQVFNEPVLNNLVLNSVFSLTSSLKKTGVERYAFFKNKEEILSALQINTESVSKKNVKTELAPTDNSAEHLNADIKQKKNSNSFLMFNKEGLFRNKNLMVIVLESFSFEYMGWPHGDRGYTPFLDQLAQKGVFFTNAYANGRRSIEGIAAIFAGVPALMEEPFISSPYMTNYFVGLGSLMSIAGYQTSFFHGAKNGTMYFDQFMKSAGVKNYYGLNEYPNAKSDFDGTWGIYDEEYLQYVAKKISQDYQNYQNDKNINGETKNGDKNTEKNFMTAVFTLSSHNPFKVPDKYKGRFPKGSLDIHESIGYTDYALEKFFEKIKEEPWFNNTLFVLTADHTYKSSRAQYNNKVGQYRVPILFYDPTQKLLPAKINATVSSHIDILPSLTYLFGLRTIDKNYLSRNLFAEAGALNEPKIPSSIFLDDKNYYLVTSKYIVKMDLQKQFQYFKATDWDLKNPIAMNDVEEQRQLQDLLKAKVQYFSESMWDNRLYYPIR